MLEVLAGKGMMVLLLMKEESRREGGGGGHRRLKKERMWTCALCLCAVGLLWVLC